jgi:hypothetical protein
MRESLLQAKIQAIWSSAAPITTLETDGALKRLNKTFYLDCAPANPAPNNGLKLNAVPESSLLNSLESLKAAIEAVQPNASINIETLLDQIILLEQKTQALEDKINP